LDNQHGAYLFYVRPMELEVPESHASATSQSPFQLQGILCELIDRSDVVRTHRLREQLTEGFGNTLRNDFAAVDLATTLISDQNAPAEERHACSELIHSRIQSALKSLDEFERLMPTDHHESENDCLPIAPLPALNEAITSAAAAAEERGIKIRLLRSPLTSHVFVAPNLLPRVYQAILEFLLFDARDESELSVGLEETPNEVTLTFANEGFGVAIDSVQELLGQDGLAKISESHGLREALDWVHRWGGRMTASSEIGAGTAIQLFLRKFH